MLKHESFVAGTAGMLDVGSEVGFGPETRLLQLNKQEAHVPGTAIKKHEERPPKQPSEKKHSSREISYTPPPHPHFGQKAFVREGGGPPPLEGYFQGWGGVYKIWPRLIFRQQSQVFSSTPKPTFWGSPKTSHVKASHPHFPHFRVRIFRVFALWNLLRPLFLLG